MRVVIVGARSTACGVASVLLNNRNFDVVGFSDKDNRRKESKLIPFFMKHYIIGN